MKELSTKCKINLLINFVTGTILRFDKLIEIFLMLIKSVTNDLEVVEI